MVEDSILFEDDKDEANKPHKRGSKEKENDGLSQDPDEYSFSSGHCLILLLGKQNGLGCVKSIYITKMLMMVIMSNSPCIEGEVHIYP